MQSTAKFILKLLFGVLFGVILFAVPLKNTCNTVFAETAKSSGGGQSDSTNPSDGYQNIKDFANMVIKTFSWFWVVPAILAGKLMNNDFAYGKIFNLDIYLWKMWVIMKTFANYALGFMLLVTILRTLFGPKDPASVIKNILPRLLVAGVLIQSSWFLLGALIDISTVMTAAVASVPIQMIQGDEYNAIVSKLAGKIPTDCTFYGDISKDSKNFADCKGNVSLDDNAKDYIAPSYKNLDGPLVFLGYAIFRFQDMSGLSTDQNTAKTMSIGMLINVFIILMFFIPTVMLFVVNIMRIFFIRLWAVFSPFVVLFAVFHDSKVAGAAKAQGMGSKIFDVGGLLGLVFQPVFVVGSMSIAFILILGLAKVFYGNDNSSEDLKKEIPISSCSDGTSVCGKIGNTGAEITIRGSILKDMKDILGGSLGYMIMTLFSAALVWGILKAGLHSSKITRGVTDSATRFIDESMKSIPILPGLPSISAFERAGNEMVNIAERGSSVQSDKLREAVGKLAGVEGGLGAADLNDLQSVINSNASYLDFAQDYFKTLNKKLSKTPTPLSNPVLSQAIEKWANDPRGKKYLTDELGIKFKGNTATLDEILSSKAGSYFIDKVLSGKITDLSNKSSIQDIKNKGNEGISTIDRNKKYPS